MQTAIETRVLIVGAGPVGLSLAIDLAWRGIDCVVAETRAFKEPPNVKCNHVAARTMEQFRRLGVAAKVRSAGLPADYPNDIAFRTSATGLELARVHIPARAERYTDKSGPDGDWPTPEPAHRINQIFLEPILAEHAAAQPAITLRNRVQVTGFAQDAQRVRAQAIDLETGEPFEIACDYLVGCDGGSSMVRKAIGARMAGQPELRNVQSTFIRAPALLGLLGGRKAWCYSNFNPRCSGTLFAIDGKERWLVHNTLDGDGPPPDRDASLRAILGVGPEFEYEVISKEDWTARRLLASRFRDRRVFIAGDAAHLWVPHAGFGMNAGIADAMNLSWLLAAHLQGWAAPSILDAYEAERYPVTDQVSHYAMSHGEGKKRMREELPPGLEAPGPEGDRIRGEWGRRAYELNVKQFCAGGLNFGYFYEGSPIIEYDAEPAPAYSMDGFTPSTVPGCRAAHFWLPDGRSLYDVLGPFYTLLKTEPALDVGPLVRAAAGRGMPLQVLELDGAQLPAAYRHKLVICRADQHVAWRGDSAGNDAQARALVDKLCARQETRHEHMETTRGGVHPGAGAGAARVGAAA